MNIDELLMSLYDKEDIAAIERTAITEFNLSNAYLMQKAAKSCVDQLIENFPNAKTVLVFCGVGNNANDGLCIADKLQSLGLSVQVIKSSDWRENLPIKADVIVDALFGSGINKDVSGPWEQIIETINNSNIPVLSVDVPSGLDPNTGKVFGIAVKAKVTITFVGLKKGLFTGKGRDYSGDIKFNNLGIPLEAYKNITCYTERLIKKHFKNTCLSRTPSSHKGNFGKILIIGGKEGMQGAPLLAGKAALRTGAGVVNVLANSSSSQGVTNLCPEIRWYNFSNQKQFKELLSEATVVLLGPGLGQDKQSKLFFDEIMKSDLPLVLDADGLNILAENATVRKNWILTPHPKEAARLLETDVAVIEEDRFSAIEKLTQKYQATVVLKGAGTLIKNYSEDKLNNKTYVCDLGNPGMATAGMGDVLSGIIAALLAQNFNIKDAANFGVFVHALSGDFAAKQGQIGTMASDLFGFIRKIINEI